MNRFLFILFLVIFEGLKAQVGSIPSPSSSMQTRYNESSIGGSSGRLVKNIPLLSYNVGKLSVPVSLNYVGNAVKVNQISGWVGINWDLEAGGVITRVVNDYPDEKATERIFFDDIESQGSNLQGWNYLEEEGDTRDYRADIFSFSFSGYSGSFYLDENFIPVIMDNDSEMKIEFIGGINATDDNTIKITTPDGNMYFFGGVNASEYSSSLVNIPREGTVTFDPNSGSFNSFNIGRAETPLAATSFYLFKIENMFGDQILFDYLDEGTKNYNLFERQKLPIVYESDPYNDLCYSIEDLNSIAKSVCKVTVYNVKKIEKIYSLNSDLELNFESSLLYLPPAGNVFVPQYDGRKLDVIKLYDKNISENVNDISFEYLLTNGANSYRFFLEKLNFNNSANSGLTCNSYKFEYKTPGLLPNRFSYSVDLLGFYNGSPNMVLLADDQNVVFDETFSGLAVRESNFNYASCGVLEKIIYPTGGYTKFQYESPEVKVLKDTKEMLNIYRNVDNSISNSKLTSSFNIGNLSPNPIEQDLSLVVGVHVMENGSYHGHKIIAEVKNVDTGQTVSSEITLFHGTYDYSKIFDLELIEGNNYTVTLKFESNTLDSNYATIYATMSAYYKDYKSFTTLGIRLKSVSSFDADNSLQDYKRFYYKKVENIGTAIDESAVVTFDSDQKNDEKQVCCDESNAANSYEVLNLIADPLNYYFASGDNQISYKYVTTSFGGDDFENGGIQQSFYVEKPEKIKQYLYGPFTEENLNINFGSSFSNSTHFNGTLLNEKIFKKDSYSNLQLEQETNYTYETTVVKELKNFVVKNTYDGCYNLNQIPFESNPPIGSYSNYSFKNRLISVEKKEYNSTANSISSITEYEYGTLKGMPIRIKTSDSKNNFQIVEYKYTTSSDISTMSFSSNYLDAYSQLENRNIYVPIEITNKYLYANNVEKIISRKAFLFKPKNNFIVAEKELYAKAENNYEGNVEYTLYDDKGNLLEITQENTFKKSYIYGYNDKIVIAEINNKAYNNISPTMISNLKDLSNDVVDDVSMNALKVALDNLRNTYPEAMIVTYVYDKYKLLRITTDARGENVYQDYDDCKHLKMVRDNNLKVIKEYQYNLNQN